MSLLPETLLTAARAAAVTAAAVPVAGRIAGVLTAGGVRGTLTRAGVAVGVLTPELLTAYGWSNLAPVLPGGAEVFTAVLLWARAVCVAAAVLAVAPPPGRTASAVATRRLLAGAGSGHRRRYWKETVLRFAGRWGPAAAVTFLLAFTPFELPTQTGATAWTVGLFEAQAAYIDLSDALRLAVWPAAVQAVVLLPAVFALAGAAKSGETRSGGVQPRRSGAWLFFAVLLTAAVPLGLVLRESAGGWTEAFGRGWRVREFAEELAVGLLFGVAAAAVASLGVTLTRRWGRLPLAALVLPGLAGPLIVSLAVLAAVQWPGVRLLRDTPLPLVFALTLTLLPRAAVLAAFGTDSRSSPIFTAHALRSGTLRQRAAAASLLWRLRDRGRFVRFALLAYWGATDVTCAAILLPPGVTTAPVRLYNLMHYGHNAVLGAATVAAVLLPAAVLAAGGPAWRFVSRRMRRRPR